jgi:hypothetical protein
VGLHSLYDVDDDEDYEGQRLTAYHEAGHAVAAIKTPDGRVKQMDICDRNEDDDENGYTFASYPKADEAFYIYAGSWSEAKFNKPSETIDLAWIRGWD